VEELDKQGAAAAAEAEQLRAALKAAEARIAELESLIASIKPPPPASGGSASPLKKMVSTPHLADQKQQLQPADEGALQKSTTMCVCVCVVTDNFTALVVYVNWLLRDDKSLSTVLPIGSKYSDVAAALFDGVVLWCVSHPMCWTPHS
jgi:hypothetical protein